jgi:hypothetical protein
MAPGGLVEHDRELSALRDAVSAARQGVVRVIVIEGPPGIGKRSLLGDRLGTRLSASTTVTRWARGRSRAVDDYPCGSWMIPAFAHAPGVTQRNDSMLFHHFLGSRPVSPSRSPPWMQSRAPR